MDQLIKDANMAGEYKGTMKEKYESKINQMFAEGEVSVARHQIRSCGPRPALGGPSVDSSRDGDASITTLPPRPDPNSCFPA